MELGLTVFFVCLGLALGLLVMFLAVMVCLAVFFALGDVRERKRGRR